MRARNSIKEKLVKETAIRLLVEHGLEGFSMNKLARACQVSVATLYIYYKDKDDLIMQVAMDEYSRMNDVLLQDFDPTLPFREGLRIQWKNRTDYLLNHPVEMKLFEQLRNSSFQDRVFQEGMLRFKDAMGKFVSNAVDRGEIEPMPVEIFWSVAYGPLYTLLRFSSEGKSLGGKPFRLSMPLLWKTFDLVIRALLKNQEP